MFLTTRNAPTLLLCILDGLGLNPNPEANAVALADTPCLDHLLRECPSSMLVTSGERVGLPEGQMGNSEVGHLNIGAGRVVEQWLLRINRALSGDFLPTSPAYRTFIENTQKRSPALHLIGLFSDGGVHSHSDHLLLLLRQLAADFSGTIHLHLITDGRDTSPHRAKEQVAELSDSLAAFPRCRIATLSGRFYAMDRDKRWERTQKAYDAIVFGAGYVADDPAQCIEQAYKSGVTDEFIEPAVFDYIGIGENDAVLFWNFRADRMRQLVRALCLEQFDGFPRAAAAPPFAASHCLAFTEYDATFNLPFLFAELEIENHLGEVISEQGLRQLRVAESEKYPHVTYFFNGGVEAAYPGEVRRLVPSPRDVRTYDLKPQMSAPEVTQAVIDALRTGGEFDLIVLNFANCDMVGHTGVLEAAITAVETVDGCLQQILATLAEVSGQAVIIADHGNAEQMVHYEDGSPHTAHTLFPVPIILFGVGAGLTVKSGGALCDVAPTVLDLMGIPKPPQMSGSSLLERLGR